MSDVSRSATGSTPIDALKGKVGDAVNRGTSNIADSATAATDNVANDMAKLREDMAAMQKHIGKFATSASGEALKTAQDVGSAVASQVSGVASQVGDAATEYANNAKEQVKTFASEMESMARKNPLGTIGATLLVGVVIGMMSRGRS